MKNSTTACCVSFAFRCAGDIFGGAILGCGVEGRAELELFAFDTERVFATVLGMTAGRLIISLRRLMTQ